MPLYEYQCSKCGEKFEVLQKFSDAPLTVHEACGGPLEKLTSAPAFHLKGSGWYATDYKSGSSAPKKESESKPESKSTESKPATETKSSETKTESKPAASTTTKTD